ncbi:MAG TPA: peptide deformylase [Nitrospiria bacterium]|nr:peptide deformylase [Nitrospiria bacterium]
MSILKTSKLGNPILRQIAKEVPLSELKNPATQKLIDDMIETMHEYDGVGLAAPQVHESKQIAVIEVHNSKRYPWAPDVPLLILVNPVFLSESDETVDGWEGCLSVEGFRGKVPRSKTVAVRFWDRNGKERRLEAEDFPAVVIQHELDHLAGKVFLDRMRDFSTLTHLKEYERFWMKPQDEETD